MFNNITNINDKFLGINTEIEENDSYFDRKIFYRYEPTNYLSLENLFMKYPFDVNDHLVDFGCGKGRVLIMAAYYSCKYLTGYELALDRYEILIKNIKNFKKNLTTIQNFQYLMKILKM